MLWKHYVTNQAAFKSEARAVLLKLTSELVILFFLFCQGFICVIFFFICIYIVFKVRVVVLGLFLDVCGTSEYSTAINLQIQI